MYLKVSKGLSMMFFSIIAQVLLSLVLIIWVLLNPSDYALLSIFGYLICDILYIVGICFISSNIGDRTPFFLVPIILIPRLLKTLRIAPTLMEFIIAIVSVYIVIYICRTTIAELEKNGNNSLTALGTLTWKLRLVLIILNLIIEFINYIATKSLLSNPSGMRILYVTLYIVSTILPLVWDIIYLIYLRSSSKAFYQLGSTTPTNNENQEI